MQAYDLSYLGIGLTAGEGMDTARYDGKTITIDDWKPKPPKNWYTYATDPQGDRTHVISTFGKGTEFIIQVPIRQKLCTAVKANY